MDRSAIRQTLKDIVEKEKGEPCGKFEDTMSLVQELGLDSVDLLNLVMQIQDRFQIILSSAELEKVQKFGDLLDLVQSKLTAAKSAA